MKRKGALQTALNKGGQREKTSSVSFHYARVWGNNPGASGWRPALSV